MPNPTFLKLGGSLLTDKTKREALRGDVLARLAAEIAASRRADPDLRLVLGHGSGSFGHTAAADHGTRSGVRGAEQWRGFAEVSDAAARLNRAVIAALLDAGVPAVGLPPSASAVVEDGVIRELAVAPIQAALAAGLLPVVFGDVAFDTMRGGTIVSTEEVLDYLALTMRPARLLLAGETPGVLDAAGQVVGRISPANYEALRPALGGSRGADVTGGMATKVAAMLELAEKVPGLVIHIFSGLEPGMLARLLIDSSLSAGTRIGS